jgi:hypothetical protein
MRVEVPYFKLILVAIGMPILKLVRILLALVLVAGLLPVRGEASAVANDHCITVNVIDHAADDTSCPSPAGSQQSHCLVSSAACFTLPLPMVAAVATAPPSAVMAWRQRIEQALAGRLHRPATPPPRI